jgi:hypothetical protein
MIKDCNKNEITDDADISTGLSIDCNSNGLPDECDPSALRAHPMTDLTIPPGQTLAMGDIVSISGGKLLYVPSKRRQLAEGIEHCESYIRSFGWELMFISNCD